MGISGAGLLVSSELIDQFLEAFFLVESRGGLELGDALKESLRVRSSREVLEVKGIDGRDAESGGKGDKASSGKCSHVLQGFFSRKILLRFS